MSKLLDHLVKGKVLVSDGAWGTFLFKKGLASGECPEEWNLSHRNEVLDIAKSYINAGSDIISTNSFGANKFKLMQYGIENKLVEICKTAVEISCEAADLHNFVMASLGPTGKFLITDDVTVEELKDNFINQVISFENGNADAVCIETFYDLDEAEQAIKAVKENTKLDAICTFTFDKTDTGFKTLMGITPETMTESLILCGADIIGANCGRGFEDMIEITRRIRSVSSSIPILIQANAGLPEIENGALIYPESPEKIRDLIPEIINAGANIIGGCCGTTPDHIKIIREVVDEFNSRNNTV